LLVRGQNRGDHGAHVTDMSANPPVQILRRRLVRLEGILVA
jgi:hypothetical protein